MYTAYDILYNDADKYYLDYEKNKHLFGNVKLEVMVENLFDLLVEFVKKEAALKKKINPNQYLSIVLNIIYPTENPYLITNNRLIDILREIEYKQIIKREEYIKPFEEAECKLLDKVDEVSLVLLFSKVDSDEQVSKEEFKKICHLASIGHKDFVREETFSYIFKMIIDNGYPVDTYDYHNIMKRFAKLVAKETGLEPIDVLLRSKEEALGDYGPFSIDTLGTDDAKRRITLYTKNLDTDHILDNINTIFHEIIHGHQIRKITEKSSVSLAMIKDLYLKDKIGKAYEDNYWYLSYEVNARRKAAHRTMEFLRLVTDTGASKYREEYLREIEHSNKSNKRTIKEEDRVLYTDIDELFKAYIGEIVSDERLWKIVSQEYNEKGDRKSILELLLKRNKTNKKFYDTLIYDHEYTIEEIESSLFGLQFYLGKSKEEREELKTRIPKKLLQSLDRQIHVSGLNKKSYDKEKVEKIRRKLQALAKNDAEFKKLCRTSERKEEHVISKNR